MIGLANTLREEVNEVTLEQIAELKRKLGVTLYDLVIAGMPVGRPASEGTVGVRALILRKMNVWVPDDVNDVPAFLLACQPPPPPPPPPPPRTFRITGTREEVQHGHCRFRRMATVDVSVEVSEADMADLFTHGRARTRDAMIRVLENHVQDYGDRTNPEYRDITQANYVVDDWSTEDSSCNDEQIAAAVDAYLETRTPNPPRTSMPGAALDDLADDEPITQEDRNIIDEAAEMAAAVERDP